jgi:hypothetical protein
VPVLLDEDGLRLRSAVATRSPVTTRSSGSRPDSRVSSAKCVDERVLIWYLRRVSAAKCCGCECGQGRNDGSYPESFTLLKHCTNRMQVDEQVGGIMFDGSYAT